MILIDIDITGFNDWKSARQSHSCFQMFLSQVFQVCNYVVFPLNSGHGEQKKLPLTLSSKPHGSKVLLWLDKYV